MLSQNKPLFPPLDIHNLQLEQLQLKSKKQRFEMGRCLYQYVDGTQRHWLKLHRASSDPISEQLQQQFEHEMACYEYFKQKQLRSCLPFQLIHSDDDINTDFEGTPLLSTNSILVLPDASLFLAESAANLSFAACLAKIWKMLNTLQEMHDLGAIHADLKHEHFVEYAGQVCLLDFEQVEFLQKRDDLPKQLCEKVTTTTATPRYMAPELFHAEAKSVQSDLYALGIILLEWLSGKRLQATTYEAWAYLHCQQLKIELPVEKLPFLLLLDGLLAKHKQQRFDSIYTVKRCLMTEIE